LLINLTCRVEAGQTLQFCFSIQNPGQGQFPPTISISHTFYPDSLTVQIMDNASTSLLSPFFCDKSCFLDIDLESEQYLTM